MYLYDFIFFSPDELPFPITDELLKLPGYKPKPRPPTLPPKERQRRHSDSVTTLTDTGVRRHSDLVPTLTTTDSGVITRVPYVEDEPIVPESRLRPKHNSVSNAIYQVYVLRILNILFSSNHNIHKSSSGLCFWASKIYRLKCLKPKNKG